MKSDNESSFIILRIHIHSLQKAVAAWLDGWCAMQHGWEANLSFCGFCRGCLSLWRSLSLDNSGKTAGHCSCGLGEVRMATHADRLRYT